MALVHSTCKVERTMKFELLLVIDGGFVIVISGRFPLCTGGDHGNLEET